MKVTLDERMSFDHVVRVHEDGTVTDEPNVYAPTVYDEDVHPCGLLTHVNPDGWVMLNGYSGQDRYAGPVMHASEFIGGTLERDILGEPGVYVAVMVECLTDEDDPNKTEDIEPAGWAVLQMKENVS